MTIRSQVSRVTAKLEAANVIYGFSECREIQFVDDVASSLNDTTFDLNAMGADGKTEQLFLIHYDVAAAGTPPVVAGKTTVTVAIGVGDAAADVRSATKAAIDLLGLFWTLDKLGTTDTLILENYYPGAVTAEVDGGTGFTFAQLIVGFGGFLGATKEAIDVSVDTSLVDVTANQFGTQILDQIFSGNNLEVSASLLEMTTARWELIIGKGAGDVEEIMAPGSNVTGFGESKLFQNATLFAGRLILHPIRLADADRSADWMFWKTLPLSSALSFDGTDTQALEVTFRPYLDSGSSTKVNLAARGDWSQKELVVS